MVLWTICDVNLDAAFSVYLDDAEARWLAMLAERRFRAVERSRAFAIFDGDGAGIGRRVQCVDPDGREAIVAAQRASFRDQRL